MANVLKMAMIVTIQQLHAAHWSQRRIALALGIDRKTKARHLKQVADFGNSPTGSAGSKGTFSPTVYQPNEFRRPILAMTQRQHWARSPSPAKPIYRSGF